MLSLLFFAILPTCLLAAHSSTTCKATAGSPNWPNQSEWEKLNKTVHGRLIKPAPFAAVCHSNQPTYSPAVCAATNWTAAATYADSPVGIMTPNFSNDSCLPQPNYPCSGEGFPVYVINASSSDHVAAGVNFARTHDIRLIVKGSGHDYLGRSNAPNSLSIWTKNIRGLHVDQEFQPHGCNSCPKFQAVALGAGQDWGEIYAALSEKGLTVVGGTGDTVGLGGYLTGGGHSPLSAKYGLAVDQILEMEVVTASGETLLANQELNSDLFWAMRGGGGATFGIMTQVTLKVYPEMQVSTVSATMVAPPQSDAFWNASMYILSQSAYLQSKGVVGYAYISPGITLGSTPVAGYLGQFLLPNGTIPELVAALKPLQDHLSTIHGLQTSYTPAYYPTLYARYQVDKNTAAVGMNEAIGNRLLDGEALADVTALRETFEKAIPVGNVANVNLISGPGLWNAQPAGGNDSVNPGWRKSYLECVLPVFWGYLNTTAQETQLKLLNDVYMPPLRELAGDTGAYLNEGFYLEPDFQHVYWGDNYPRLLSIKQKWDPTDLFWCTVCVGSEGWAEQGDKLCRQAPPPCDA